MKKLIKYLLFIFVIMLCCISCNHKTKPDQIKGVIWKSNDELNICITYEQLNKNINEIEKLEDVYGTICISNELFYFSFNFISINTCFVTITDGNEICLEALGKGNSKKVKNKNYNYILTISLYSGTLIDYYINQGLDFPFETITLYGYKM